MVKSKEKVNGKVTEIIIYVTPTKVSSRMIRKVVMVFLLGKVVTFTKENTKTLTEKVMEKCIGQMEAIIMVNGVKTYKMVLEEWFLQTVQ